MKLAKRMNQIPFSGIRKVFEKVGQLEDAGKKIIHLEIGRPDFTTPANIVGACKFALDEGQVHYTSNYGISSLRQAITEKFRKDNLLEYNYRDEVIVTAGANEAVFVAMMAFLEPGDEILIPSPCWPTYFSCAHMAGATPVAVKMKEDFQLDVATLEKAVNPKTRMLVVNTPHNPTGTVYKRKTLMEVAEFVKAHDLYLISDEIYEKIIYDGNKHISIGALPGMKARTITINGFSKGYAMTGWRLGYIGAPKALCDVMIRIHQNIMACATSFAQWGGMEALNGSQKEVQKMTSQFSARRDLVVSRLNAIPGISVLNPGGAFYAFMDVSKLEMASEKLAEYILEEALVALVPGSVFGVYANDYLRLSYANSYENLKQALDNIAWAVKQL